MNVKLRIGKHDFEYFYHPLLFFVPGDNFDRYRSTAGHNKQKYAVFSVNNSHLRDLSKTKGSDSPQAINIYIIVNLLISLLRA